MRVYKITESQLKKMITGKVKEVLSEAKANLPYNAFKRDMKKLGFVWDESPDGSLVKFTIPEYGDCSLVSIHEPHNRDGIDPASLREVRDVLYKIGWFNDSKNISKFPFAKWGLPIIRMTVNTTQQEIQAANQKYANAEVWSAYPNVKDSICVLKIGEKYNLCNSSIDRRPKYTDTWFDEYVYGDGGQPPCLNIIMEENGGMKIFSYPINRDGSLGEPQIIENRTYNKKKRLWK